jgi:hypothetical protein
MPSFSVFNNQGGNSYQQLTLLVGSNLAKNYKSIAYLGPFLAMSDTWLRISRNVTADFAGW